MHKAGGSWFSLVTEVFPLKSKKKMEKRPSCQECTRSPMLNSKTRKRNKFKNQKEKKKEVIENPIKTIRTNEKF